MITDQMVEKALETMRTKAEELGQAKANRVYLEQFRKSKKALLYSKAPEGTIADKENWCYRDPEYMELLDGLKAAVEIEETLRWKMTAAEAYVDVYRTQQANARAVDAGHR